MNFETATQRDVLSLYRRAYKAEKLSDRIGSNNLVAKGLLVKAKKLRNKAVCMSAAVRLREQSNRPLKNIR